MTKENGWHLNIYGQIDLIFHVHKCLSYEVSMIKTVARKTVNRWRDDDTNTWTIYDGLSDIYVKLANN